MWPFTSKQARDPRITKEKLQAASELLNRLERVHAMDGLQNVTAGLGTDRDKRSYTGFSVVAPLSRATLDTLWRSSAAVKRGVGCRAEDMTRNWIAPMWDGKDKDKNRTQAVREVEQEFRVRAKVLEGVTWGRLYGGGALIVGSQSQPNIEEELDVERMPKGDLRYLLCVDRWRLGAVELMNQGADIASPNFNKPKYYMLAGGEAESGARIHWSRVITFGGSRIPYYEYLRNGMWEDSVVQHALDDIKDYSSVLALLASMFFEASVDVMMVEGLAKTLALPKGDLKINNRFNLAAMQKSVNRMLIMDANDKYDKKGVNFSGLGAVVQDFRDHLCMVFDTPASRFFGQTPGGLNTTGEGDERNYATSIHNEQEVAMRPVFDRLYPILLRHKIGEIPAGWSYEFNPLYEESKAEKASRQFQNAQRDAIYVDMGAISAHTVAKQLKEDGVYSMLEDAEVNMVNDLEESATEEQMNQAKEMALKAKALPPKAPGAPPVK